MKRVEYITEIKSDIYDKVVSIIEEYKGNDAKELFKKLKPLLESPQILEDGTKREEGVTGIMIGNKIFIEGCEKYINKDRRSIIVTFE